MTVTDAQFTMLVETALDASAREYPHKLDQELNADEDLLPPRQLNPSFYGSYDWHSAVHNHWLLVRALDRGLPSELEGAVVARLDEHLSEERLATELAFFAGPGGRVSERPYGWAWLVLLHAECAATPDPRFRRWAAALGPLATLLADRLDDYFARTLAFPIRTGTHGNTAFSLQLTLEAALRRNDRRAAETLAEAARRFFLADTSLPWAEAPAGDAFLTPPLVEAALLAEILEPEDLARWLDRSLPDPQVAAWAPPTFAPNESDPGTVHLEGLLTTRAWCLRALGARLPASHPAVDLAREASDAHVEAVSELRPADGFNRAHWVPTFVLYLDERLRRLGANS